ncbi:MAG: ABC transporter permease subunit [Oscillospiraceae bacterium]|nr:ABC transporter permease subunit [Oscillospiraceae bacterium]
MLAIMKRELLSYFTSPLGYVFVAVFYLFSGVFLYLFTLYSQSADMSSVYIGMFFVMLIMIPILTMRLMAEENRQKTDQLLLTSPVSLPRLVMGKFLSAFSILVMCVLIFVVYGIVLSCFAEMNWAIIWGNIVGMLLLGSLCVSSGLFVSTLTENQMIAAVGSIGLNIAFILVDSFASVMPFKFLQDVFYSLSFYSRYNEFTLGIFSLSNVFFFVSVAFVFLFLTVRVLEKRRWA